MKHRKEFEVLLINTLNPKYEGVKYATKIKTDKHGNAILDRQGNCIYVKYESQIAYQWFLKGKEDAETISTPV